MLYQWRVQFKKQNLSAHNPLACYIQIMKQKMLQLLLNPDSRQLSCYLYTVCPANQSELSPCLVISHIFTPYDVQRVLDVLKTIHNRFTIDKFAGFTQTQKPNTMNNNVTTFSPCHYIIIIM